jgi:hypothetical protein
MSLAFALVGLQSEAGWKNPPHPQMLLSCRVSLAVHLVAFGILVFTFAVKGKMFLKVF